MKAIVPTAGVGSRLRPFTHTVPKVLLQVADKPILGHILDRIIEIGVNEVTFVVGYRGQMIEEYVRRAYPNLCANFVEQPDTRGLGHAILLTASHHRADTEPVLIILGDTILDADLSVLRGAQSDMIGVCEVEDPRRFGVVQLDGDRIVSMVEKPEQPPSNLAIVGVYYLRRPADLFAALERNVEEGRLTQGEIQLTDGLARMIEQGATMRAFRVKGWYDCGTPESLLATNEVLLRERFAEGAETIQARYPGARITPPVYVDPSAQLGNCIVGPNVTVGAGAHISQAIVRNSIVNAGATVQNVILTDSIIGNDARVQESSLRLYVGDRSEILFG
jgi:glucose-1-phosphate thymidylyltransferase